MIFSRFFLNVLHLFKKMPKCVYWKLITINRFSLIAKNLQNVCFSYFFFCRCVLDSKLGVFILFRDFYDYLHWYHKNSLIQYWYETVNFFHLNSVDLAFSKFLFKTFSWVFSNSSGLAFVFFWHTSIMLMNCTLPSCDWLLFLCSLTSIIQSSTAIGSDWKIDSVCRFL